MRPWLLIGLALVFGGVAAWFAGMAGSGGSAETVQVVIANFDIPAGTPFNERDVKGVPWPKNRLPQGGFSAPSDVIGRVSKIPVLAGEPIMEGKLASKDARGGLSAIITPGKRAISVKVNEVIAVAGFALPGSYVDVLLSSREALSQPFSSLVLERVKVLAVAQETASPDGGKAKVVEAVTLELTPAEAEKLDLARTVGALSLVLRNDADQGGSTSRGAFLRDLAPSHRLIGISTSTEGDGKATGPDRATSAASKSVATGGYAATQELAVRRTKVEVIRGNNRNEVEF